MKTPQLPPPLPLAFYQAPTPKEKIEALAAKPMAPKKAQAPADFGLFDLNARKQEDLF